MVLNLKSYNGAGRNSNHVSESAETWQVVHRGVLGRVSYSKAESGDLEGVEPGSGV